MSSTNKKCLFVISKAFNCKGKSVSSISDLRTTLGRTSNFTIYECSLAGTKTPLFICTHSMENLCKIDDLVNYRTKTKMGRLLVTGVARSCDGRLLMDAHTSELDKGLFYVLDSVHLVN